MEATLRLYNTLTRSKEEFAPLDASNVRMYVCGPTVYDFAHIGNARPVIVFDVLFRLLRHIYGKDHVTYVRNITDIDDKINRRAFESWTRERPLLADVKTLTQGTAAQYEADVAALGCLPPTHSPRATDFVCDGQQPMDMVRVIERLVAKGVAYEAERHVLFSPSAMSKLPGVPDYGRLSRRPLDEMIAGARVDVAPYKRDPMDFVLWKPSDPATEPGWDSPWGFGRPGWHIECSAMAGALLGESFDIHGGGIDLVFPHHENEIAQTCCAFGLERMASIWMHNGFLQVEGQKMSKSLGNFVTISELLATKTFGGRPWPGAVLRLAMLKSHYRQPIDWTLRALEEAEGNLRRLHETAQEYVPTEVCPDFIERIFDDLNLKAGIDRLFQLSEFASAGDVIAGGMLAASLALIGLEPETAAMVGPGYGIDDLGNIEYQENFWDYVRRIVPRNAWAKNVREKFKAAVKSGAVSQAVADRILEPLRYLEDRSPVEHAWSNLERASSINRNIEARLEARRQKNFALSDKLRDELLGMGVQVKDGKDPATGEPVTTWELKR